MIKSTIQGIFLREEIEAFIFSLCGTLVEYYTESEFPEILRQCISKVRSYLVNGNFIERNINDVWFGMENENHESPDHAVRPLAQRLFNIFHVDHFQQSRHLADAMCEEFLKPIFARGRVYKDVFDFLGIICERGCKTAIISNLPWGSPSLQWMEELSRLGLNRFIELAVFSTDIGWCKPAPQIFEYTTQVLNVESDKCVFVGDDPRCDYIGALEFGMKPVLIDRRRVHVGQDHVTIGSLMELI
ncbi:MAG: HAD family hydrolase [Promethearchaeota archaeon]